MCGETPASSIDIILSSIVVGLVVVVAKIAERLSMGDRLRLCRQRPFPWLPMMDLNEKRQSVVLNSLL